LKRIKITFGATFGHFLTSCKSLLLSSFPFEMPLTLIASSKSM